MCRARVEREVANKYTLKKKWVLAGAKDPGAIAKKFPEPTNDGGKDRAEPVLTKCLASTIRSPQQHPLGAGQRTDPIT